MFDFLFHLLIIIMIYSVLSLSLQLTVGYTGLMNFGHIAFFGIGAYVSVLLMFGGMPYVIALFGAGVAGGMAGFFLTWAVRKLKGDYLAFTTLGFSFVMVSIFLNWTSLTRGPLGLPGIPRPDIFGVSLRSQFFYLIFTCVVAVVSYVFFHRVVQSRYGTLLEGVRDNEQYVSALGKNTFRIKTQSMCIAGFFAGLAGSLYAHYINFIDPYSFSLSEIIVVFTMVIVGGLASLSGTVQAVILLVLIPEILRFFALPASILGPARHMIFAVTLLLILMYRPLGLRGKVQFQDE